MNPYSKSLKQNARTLRSNMTDAEQILWQKVRRKQMHGLQFYRQKPLLTHIVDFYCPKAKLVIELDGGQHYEPEQQKQDREREKQLEKLGLHIIRFTNREVLEEIERVMEVIWEVCASSNPSNPPLPT